MQQVTFFSSCIFAFGECLPRGTEERAINEMGVSCCLDVTPWSDVGISLCNSVTAMEEKMAIT
jgi:hypothetical protein